MDNRVKCRIIVANHREVFTAQREVNAIIGINKYKDNDIRIYDSVLSSENYIKNFENEDI